MAKFLWKDLKLEIPKEVYEPREDSALLADFLENKIKIWKGKKVLDMGCGSGIQAIIAAKAGCEVTAIDINPKAIEAAKNNSESNSEKIKFIVSDLFENIEKEKFDLIIFNAPYLPEKISSFSREWAAGENSELIFKFIKQAKKFLLPRGEVLLIISSLSGKEKILSAFKKEGFSAKIAAKKKIPFEELYLVEAVLKRNL